MTLSASLSARAQELFDPSSYPDILYYEKLRTLPAGRRPKDAPVEPPKAADAAGKRPLVQEVSIGGTAQAVNASAAQAAASAIASRLSASAGDAANSQLRKKGRWDSASKAPPGLAASLAGAPSISMASTGIAQLDFERIRQLTAKK